MASSSGPGPYLKVPLDEVANRGALDAPVGVRAVLHNVGVTRVGGGMVPCASQRWGKVVTVVKADHLEQVGWSRVFDAPAFYGGLVGHVGCRGF